MPQHIQYDPRFPVSVMDIVLMGRLGVTRPDVARPDVAQPPSAVPSKLHSRGRLCYLWEHLRGFAGWYGRSDRRAALNALEEVGMEDSRRQPFSSLSGGQRQRVLIARALCCEPDLLLLDEPTSNIDTLVEARLLELLAELNRRMAIVMVSHDLGIVSGLVERVICVNRRVVSHPTSALTGETIRDLYGGEVRMVHHHQSSTQGHAHD